LEKFTATGPQHSTVVIVALGRHFGG